MDHSWENWHWVCTDQSPVESPINRVTTTYTYYIPLHNFDIDFNFDIWEGDYGMGRGYMPTFIQNVDTNYHMDIIHVDNILDDIVHFWAPLTRLGLHIDNVDDYLYTFAQPGLVRSIFALPYIDPMSDWDELEDMQ